MDKYFMLLGVKEDATEEEVTAAYEKRTERYKSLDYADDPDYVRRKLSQLKEAYDAIMKGEPKKVQKKASSKNSANNPEKLNLKTVSEKGKKIIDNTLGSDKKDNANLAGTVISIITAIVLLFSQVFSSDNQEITYDDYEEGTAVYMEKDQDLIDYSQMAYDNLIETGEYEETTKIDEKKLGQLAQEVSEKYFKTDDFYDLKTYLIENYGLLLNDEEEDYMYSLNTIFEWASFPSYDYCLGYKNPFDENEDVISDYNEYIKYFIDIYDEYNEEYDIE